MSQASSSELSSQFMTALRRAEETGEPDPVVAVFSSEATAETGSKVDIASGIDEIRDYWRRYLENFSDIHSEFDRVHNGEGFAVMEWTSTGTLRQTGKPIRYRGVSIIEADGNTLVSRFRTFFDSAAFTPEGATHA